jgi:DNA-binding response OmpR family regulator
MEPGVAQLRVLIVTDDRMLMQTLVSYATGIGIRAVAKAESGEKALQHIRGAKPAFDVVVCDGEMPGFSGIDLVKALRAEKSAVGFLMLTARADLAGAVLAKRHGASDCLAKPFNQHQLGDKLRAITQTSRRPAA